MAESLWLEEPAPEIPHRPLDGAPDVVVVGGGVTGCACALALARGGLRVRLHEARTIASGASGRNGGFALRGGASAYDVARGAIGSSHARSLWLLTERFLKRLEELAGDAFTRSGSLRLAADEAERTALRREYDALRADGFDVDWRDELEPPLGGRFFGAVFHPCDGSLHPVRWVRSLAVRAAEEGVEICERSRVETLSALHSEHVVIATDGYTRGLLPALDEAVRPTRGQIVATTPLATRLFACPHYARGGYDYWQQLADGRLLVGGWRDASLDTEYTSDESVTPVIQEKIEAFLRGVLGVRAPVAHRWSGIFGTTADRLPLAGRVPGAAGVWAACGYSGHGNVLGLACGELVAAAILGRARPELALFDPARVLADVPPVEPNSTVTARSAS